MGKATRACRGAASGETQASGAISATVRSRSTPSGRRSGSTIACRAGPVRMGAGAVRLDVDAEAVQDRREEDVVADEGDDLDDFVVAPHGAGPCEQLVVE